MLFPGTHQTMIGWEKSTEHRQRNEEIYRTHLLSSAEVPNENGRVLVRLQWSRPVSRGLCDHEIEVHDHFRWEPLRRRVGHTDKVSGLNELKI